MKLRTVVSFITTALYWRNLCRKGDEDRARSLRDPNNPNPSRTSIFGKMKNDIVSKSRSELRDEEEVEENKAERRPKGFGLATAASFVVLLVRLQRDYLVSFRELYMFKYILMLII